MSEIYSEASTKFIAIILAITTHNLDRFSCIMRNPKMLPNKNKNGIINNVRNRLTPSLEKWI
jgi:hypothetical protein